MGIRKNIRRANLPSGLPKIGNTDALVENVFERPTRTTFRKALDGFPKVAQVQIVVKTASGNITPTMNQVLVFVYLQQKGQHDLCCFRNVVVRDSSEVAKPTH